MSEIWWTMALIAVPVLIFGRPGLAHWQRGSPPGLLRFLVIWGWVVALALFLIWLGKNGQLELDHGAALFYALTFLAAFSAGTELARRRRSGDMAAQPAANGHRAQGSPTPERPLSFMQSLQAQEAQLSAGAAEVSSRVTPPTAPAPSAIRAAAAHVPVVSIFGAPASPASPAGPPPVAVHAPAAATPPPPRAQSAATHEKHMRRALQRRMVAALQAYAEDTEADPALGPAITPDETGSATVSVDSWVAPPAAAPDPVPSSAGFEPPSGPAPSGPVTLGSGFSYKPQLVESRLGQAAPQNGSSSAL